MPDKKISKIIYGGNTLIDLTADTVTANSLLSGYTAHGADGEAINGSCSFDSDTSNDTAVSSEILEGKTAHAKGLLVNGAMPNRGAVNGTISAKAEQYTIPNGYHDGSGKVGISSTEQAKIIPSNIREGVVLLGVEGEMSGSEDVHAQTRSVTPAVTAQTILPETGYNYLTQVNVAAIPYTTAENSAGGLTATIG